MKAFISEYGRSILAAIVVILLILMISPVQLKVKNALVETVDKSDDLVYIPDEEIPLAENEPEMVVSEVEGSEVNSITSNKIGETLIQLMKEVNSQNSTKITVTVYSSGDYAVKIEGNKPRLTKEDVAARLIDEGIVGSNNKIEFDIEDEIYIDGYSVKVNKNNGNGGKITVTKL